MASAPTQPATQYGPFTAGGLIRRTFEIYRNYAGLFLSIALVYVGAYLLFLIPSRASRHFLHHLAGIGPGHVAFLSFFQLALVLVGIFWLTLVSSITRAAGFFATSAVLRGEPTTATQCLEITRPHIGRVVLADLSVLFRAWLWGMLAAVPLVVLLFIVAFAITLGARFGTGGIGAQAGGAAPSAITIAGFTLGFLFVVFLLVFVVARYAVTLPALLQEGLGPNVAVRRSVDLSRKDHGRIYAFYGLTVVLIILNLAIVLPLNRLTARVHGGTAIALTAITIAFELLYAWLIPPLSSIGTALCYFDLRARKEGFPFYPPPASMLAGVPPMFANQSPGYNDPRYNDPGYSARVPNPSGPGPVEPEPEPSFPGGPIDPPHDPTDPESPAEPRHNPIDPPTSPDSI